MGTETTLKTTETTEKKPEIVTSELEKFHLFYEQPAPIKRRNARLSRVVKRSTN